MAARDAVRHALCARVAFQAYVAGRPRVHDQHVALRSQVAAKRRVEDVGDRRQPPTKGEHTLSIYVPFYACPTSLYVDGSQDVPSSPPPHKAPASARSSRGVGSHTNDKRATLSSATELYRVLRDTIDPSSRVKRRPAEPGCEYRKLGGAADSAWWQ
jgi:hypothetical protein